MRLVRLLFSFDQVEPVMQPHVLPLDIRGRMRRLEATCTAANTHTRYGVYVFTLEPLPPGRSVARHADHPPGDRKWAERSADADATDRAWIRVLSAGH